MNISTARREKSPVEKIKDLKEFFAHISRSNLVVEF